MIGIPITQARKSLFLYLILEKETRFIHLGNLKVKEDKVAENLEIADKKDKTVEAMNGKGVPYKISKTKFGYS